MSARVAAPRGDHIGVESDRLPMACADGCRNGESRRSSAALAATWGYWFLLVRESPSSAAPIYTDAYGWRLDSPSTPPLACWIHTSMSAPLSDPRGDSGRLTGGRRVRRWRAWAIPS